MTIFFLRKHKMLIKKKRKHTYITKVANILALELKNKLFSMNVKIVETP